MADISGGNTGTGGGSGADGSTDTSASIGLSLYSRVTATITNIQIINTGTDLRCSLVSNPVIENLAGIENVMLLAGVAECPPGSYNRIQIQFDRRVDLLSGPTGTPEVCYFDSYKDTGNSSQPNILHCAENTCTLSINGAVNVLVNQLTRSLSIFISKTLRFQIRTHPTAP